MVLNQSYADYLITAFQNNSLLYIIYHNVSIYHLSIHPTTGEAGAWICVDREAIVFSGTNDNDLIGIKKVINANYTSFFNNEALKIGYLLTSNNKENFIFSYYAWTTNDNNVDWEMRSASNPALPEVRTSFHFQTQADLDKSSSYFIANILSSAKSIVVSPTFLIGTYEYHQNQINNLIFGL